MHMNNERYNVMNITLYDYERQFILLFIALTIIINNSLYIYSNELNTFNAWMDGAYRSLEDKEGSISKLSHIPGQAEEIRQLVSDVIAHQADLRFITMSAQKFHDESKVRVLL